MKIGIITTWFERGAAYVSKQFADALHDAGHEVFVYARGGESYAIGDPNWDFDWVHWGKVHFWQHDMKVERRDFSKWLKKNNIDRVIFNEQRHWDAVHICHHLKVPTILYVDYYKENEIDGFRNYDALICNTKRHYSVFDWHPNAFYFPWGTDVDLYHPDTFDRVSQEYVTFFHSAGMSPLRKGTDYLIKAFSLLDDPRGKLIIHTQTRIESTFPHLTDLLKKLKDAGRLEIIHKTVGAPGLYHLGDVYVYPTRLEGIGLTICEAQACGLPVIVPDNGPMNEFVESEAGGCVVKISQYTSRSDGYYWPMCHIDCDDLANAMRRYIDCFDAIPSMKRAARHYAETQRNWAINAADLPRVIATFDPLSDVVLETARKSVKEVGFYGFLYSKLNGRYLNRLKPLKKIWTNVRAGK